MSVINARKRFTEKQIFDALAVCRRQQESAVRRYYRSIDEIIADLKILEKRYDISTDEK